MVPTAYFQTTPIDAKIHPGLAGEVQSAALFDPAYLAVGNGAITNGMLLGYLAVVNRIPLVGYTTYAQSGGLIGYGASSIDIYRRAGYYIDAVLKGVQPADLPVELPTKFDLTVNLRAAKALGITLPTLVLAEAAQVIE